MPNVLSAEPVGELAHRLASIIPDANVAQRFAKLARLQLFADKRNFRPATHRELKRAPAWAKDASAQGTVISKFVANRSAAARLRRVARRLAAVCDDIATHACALPAQREFIAKLDRASFEAIEAKTLAFEIERKARLEQAIIAAPLYPAIEIYSSPGRIWRRIVSLEELWRAGAEFGNCLARSSRHNGGYARRMREGFSQFWVLRDAMGKGLIVLMANVAENRIVEVRGPRNAIIPFDDPDLKQLALARSLLRPHDPSDPPPGPRPPRASLAVALSLIDTPFLDLGAIQLPRGQRRN